MIRRPISRPLSYVRVRVTLVATLAALVVAVVGSLVFVSSLRTSLEGGLESSASQDVSAVQAQLTRGEPPESAVVSGKNDVIVQIVATTGAVVASDHPRITTPIVVVAGTRNGVRIKRLEDKYIVVARRQKNSDRLIVAGRSTESVGRATEAAAVLLALSVPVGLALLAIAVWISVGRALRPVERMRREADTITSAHLDRRLALPEGRDEIPRLARTLNEMLDRIDASQRLQRQFVSDASHELRSPLTTLRQIAEIARDYPDQVPEGQLARDVLAEEQRMEDLVTALLVLARVDDGASAARHPVDLDDVVLESVRRVRTGSTRPGEPDEPAPVIDATGVSAGQVTGEPVLIGRVVDNLLSNAVRHARSAVVVGVGEDDSPGGGRVLLTVDDDGNGIAPDQRDRIFERFVRLDESRARDDGGSGLGLAIVRQVVEAMAGTVEVSTSPAGGARFTVSFPTDRPPLTPR